MSPPPVIRLKTNPGRSGYLVGRSSSGSGPLELLNLNKLRGMGVARVADVIRSFLGLSDTPASYSGQSGYLLAVTAAEDGVGFEVGVKVHLGVLITTPLLVSALPAAAPALKGARAFVTDALTTLPLGLGLAVVGGGANAVPAYCDGADWLYG